MRDKLPAAIACGFAALIVAAVLAAGVVDPRKTQPCHDWAADQGLGRSAQILMCDAGPNPTEPMTEAEFWARADASLETVMAIINEDGGL